ncbi:MAG: hypothetical protein AAFR21_10400 [Pseudomonadota bacterium]
MQLFRKTLRLSSQAPTGILLSALALLMFGFQSGAHNADVSWLTDMCARILAGERAYVDIFETTPPIPALLYMPGAAAELYFGWPAEAVIIGYVSIFYVLVLTYAAQLGPVSIKDAVSFKAIFIAPAAFFIFVLTHDTFAQREAIALAAMTPLLSAAIKRTEGHDWPLWHHQVAVGALAGFGAAVKPPIFAIPLLILGAYLVISERRLDPLWKSGLITSAITFTTLTGFSLLMFPEYLTGVVPLMQEIYVRTTVSLSTYLGSKPLFVFLTLTAGFLILIRKEKITPTLSIPAVMALGFFVVFILQGKLFHYHALPAVYFGYLALCLAGGLALQKWMASDDQPNTFFSLGSVPVGFKQIALISGISIIFPAITYDLCTDDKYPFADLAWSEDLDKPTALGISPTILTSFPLSRTIDAKWIDRIHSQWVVHYSNIMLSREATSPEIRAKYERWRDNELERVADLIRDEQPEIIIHCVMGGARELNERLLDLSPNLLAPYTAIAEERGIRILRRTSAIGGDRTDDRIAFESDVQTD